MAGEEVEGLSLIFQGIRLRAAPFPAFDEFQSCRCSRASSFNRKRAITGHLIVRENNRITSSARGSNKNRTVAAYPPSARRTVWLPCKKRRKSNRSGNPSRSGSKAFRKIAAPTLFPRFSGLPGTHHCASRCVQPHVTARSFRPLL